jgi:hypothetical protein
MKSQPNPPQVPTGNNETVGLVTSDAIVLTSIWILVATKALCHLSSASGIGSSSCECTCQGVSTHIGPAVDRPLIDVDPHRFTINSHRPSIDSRRSDMQSLLIDH